MGRRWLDKPAGNLFRKQPFSKATTFCQRKEDESPTLRANINFLQLFYKSLLARRMYLSNQDILTLSSNDVVLIRSAQELTEGWLKSLAKSVAYCNQDLHQVCIFALFRRTAQLENSAVQNSNLRISFSFQEDEERNITLEQFHEMANLPMNVQVKRRFLALDTRNITDIGREDYTCYRDHLIMKLLCRSGQRPGALANLTIEEFKNGQWNEESDLFITQTQVHKTSATEGAATLFWNQRNFKLGQIYLKKLRPLVVSGGKEKFVPVPGVAKQREGFFLNHSGKVMTGRQITRRVTELVRKAFPNQDLSFHVSWLRKHVVTPATVVGRIPQYRQQTSRARCLTTSGRLKGIITLRMTSRGRLVGSIHPRNERALHIPGTCSSLRSRKEKMERRALAETSSSSDDEAPPPP